MERKSVEGMSPDLLQFIGLERPKVRWPKGLVQKNISPVGPKRKRLAPQELVGEPKKFALLEEEPLTDTVGIDLENLTLDPKLTVT